MAANQSGMLDPRGGPTAADQLVLPPPPPYPHARKKLYFSPEFFEPDLMVDPPPVAEEFLYEVRRMIDLAKNRIRSRRYIPSLLVIPEEGSGQERKLSDMSTCSSITYAIGAGRATHSMLERRDSFSKMAQEPAPEETLTIQELEHEREHAESPRSSGSADSRIAADSSGGGPPSSSSGCDGGGGDRSSGEAVSGGRVSLDSGLGGDEDSSGKAKKSSTVATSPGEKDSGGDKVSHWLSRLPPTMELEESDQPNGARHSKLYDYFNARQRMARLTEESDRNNIIRVQVNEDVGQQHNSPPLIASSTSPGTLDANPYRRRYPLPLDGASTSAPETSRDSIWQYRSPESTYLAEVHKPKYGSEMTETAASPVISTVDDRPYMNGLSRTKMYYSRPVSTAPQFVAVASIPSPTSSTTTAQNPSHSAYFSYTRDQSA